MLLSKKLLTQIEKNFSKITNEDLANALISIGIEVENVIEHKVNPNLKIGRLISFKKHPDSDHLNVCNVVIGTEKYQIVCGAKNLKENQWVVVALEGVELKPNFVIKNRVIRGIESQGMLCSIAEILDIDANLLSSEDLETIIQIPHHVSINEKTFFDDFAFNDTIFELSIPSNRPELNGLYFLAYELNLQFSFTTKKIDSKISIKENAGDLTVLIDELGSLNYNLIELKNDFNYANAWVIKLILLNNNIKVFNNHNDISNFLSLIMAQPVLCIKSSSIIGNIRVTTLKNDNVIIDSYNKTHTLKKGTIVTLNANNEIVSVTGRYLNQKYLPSFEDETFYLEVVNFDQKTSIEQNRLNKFNDQIASYYHKSVSNSISLMTLNFIFEHEKLLMVEFLKLIKVGQPGKQKIIHFKKNQLLNFLGIDLKTNQISYILKRIGISLVVNKIIVPSYRNDLLTFADIAEELLKSFDINNFQATPIITQIVDFKPINEFESYKSLINCLIGKQFYEVKTYNLASQKKSNYFNWFNITNSIKINNAISSEREFLRKNNLMQMLEVIAYNKNHKKENLNIFEIQKIQTSNNESIDILSCVINAPTFVEPLSNSKVNSSIYYSKALMDVICQIYKFVPKLKFNQNSFEELYSENNIAYYNNDKLVAVVGQLKNVFLQNELSINENLYCISINLTELQNAEQVKETIKIPSEFNPIYKTITFSNPQKIQLDSLYLDILKNEYITDIRLVDVYSKGEETRYTVSIKIQPINNNLIADEINNIFQTVIQQMREKSLVVKE